MISRRHFLSLAAGALGTRSLPAAIAEDSPLLRQQVETGQLPPLSQRLPRNPRVIDLPALGKVPGRVGGDLRTLIGGQRDIRYVPIYSYSRLVGYDLQLNLVPDILEAFEVEQGRRFTFHLRDGHRWSDGSAFTAADFDYYWHDVILNSEMLRGGPPAKLKVDGEVARFEVLDRLTVRYSWDQPNPRFLPLLAAPIPLTLALPSDYMRQFHARHQAPEELARLVKQYRVSDWVGLHRKLSRQNRPENPDLPTLEAWRPRTAPPAEQFIFERNPHFHRVDERGRQLPYIDRLVLNVSSPDIISAKTGTGESDLQARGIDLPDYTLIKEAEARFPIRVSLWRRTRGSAVVLFPNMNCRDAQWRSLFQDVRMRRALSLAVNRREINQVIYYGLARESANTILPESPLFRPELASAWAGHDPDQANRLLDELGLSRPDRGGIRRLPDGREANITVESAGESTLETDVLELIRDHFRQIGIALFVRSSQRDVFRSRILGGEVMMSVWQGLDNALPTADMPPVELAPSGDDQLQWPVWGLYRMSGKTQGRPADLAPVQQLGSLLEAWMLSTDTAERTRIWTQMLTIHAEQVFTIGTINATLQPIVRSARLHNLPEEGLFGFQPTSYFGAYLPDTFWLDPKG